MNPHRFSDFEEMRDVVPAILRAYLDRSYRVQHRQWDSAHMVYQTLSADGPHGMWQPKAYWRDDNVRLHERLNHFGKKVRLPKKLGTVGLNSFIISKTPYSELRQMYGEGNWDRERFGATQIPFAEGDGYARVLLGGAINR